MKELSTQQIVDASGEFGEIAQVSGAEFERPQAELQHSSFNEITYMLGIETASNTVMLKRAEVVNASEQLTKLQGARVVVGALTEDKKPVYLPGVILADQIYGIRFGCLVSVLDTRLPEIKEAQKPLTDMQQVLLAKMYAEHQPNAAQHGTGGGVNAGEPNHAVLIAASLDPDNIHKRTHELVEAGSFSADVANSGATTIFTKYGSRRNDELMLTPSQIAGIVIVESHQIPWPLEGNVFDLSAGLTHAARLTQEVQPNLQANFESITT